MCLAIPGKILSMQESGVLFHSGKVSFGGVVKEVNLSFVSDAKVGDYVVVHAGFAISKLDEDAAKQVLDYFTAE